MDLDSIFNLFNNEEDYNDETSLLMDFSEHPLFWISGFNKVIDNHLFFKLYTVKNFRNISPDINIEELERAGEKLMFIKAWEYIQDMDLSKGFHVECIKLKASKEFVHNLQITIKFFEDLEEYEKCALLKKIENKVNEFLI
jgi:hypothetical protein